LKPQKPPSELFHGTASRFIESIFQSGLVAGKRQHVHLSTNKNTAYKVGQRYGKPLILCVDAENMFNQGFQFLLSNNNVWLIEHVPPGFLTIKE
jgi:putative RNA 2'-phosphotransferase